MLPKSYSSDDLIMSKSQIYSDILSDQDGIVLDKQLQRAGMVQSDSSLSESDDSSSSDDDSKISENRHPIFMMTPQEREEMHRLARFNILDHIMQNRNALDDDDDEDISIESSTDGEEDTDFSDDLESDEDDTLQATKAIDLTPQNGDTTDF